jgi:hypothetical protein
VFTQDFDSSLTPGYHHTYDVITITQWWGWSYFRALSEVVLNSLTKQNKTYPNTCSQRGWMKTENDEINFSMAKNCSVSTQSVLSRLIWSGLIFWINGPLLLVLCYKLFIVADMMRSNFLAIWPFTLPRNFVQDQNVVINEGSLYATDSIQTAAAAAHVINTELHQVFLLLHLKTGCSPKQKNK